MNIQSQDKDYGGKYWRKPLDFDKHKSLKYTINLIKERCKGCEFCVEFCPAGILKPSDEFNSKGYHPPYVIDQDKCNGCKLCELICPEFAIYITDNNKKKQEK